MLRALRKHLRLEAGDARALIEAVFKHHPAPNFAVRLWDGQEIGWNGQRDFTLVFTGPETFRRCFAARDPEQFAEAYVDGTLLIEGDLWAAAGLASSLHKLELEFRGVLKYAPRLLRLRRKDRADVQSHYDLSDELFRLFLDEKMVYSCAYFSHPDQALELAQDRKLELSCRKLGLRPGERLLDIGCGWGALPIWAAQRYGVRAHGITLSEHQVAEARRRAASAGVADRVTIALCHYADLPSRGYDKISSIGMYEHVGVARLGDYFGAVHRSLRPGGLFLNHGITRPAHQGKATGGAFVLRRVFPGAELAPVSRIQTEMEHTGFEILDVQSLRQHYALTLREWFRRFTANRAEAARSVPERVLRTWELYLAGCSRAFEDGIVSVHQVLAGKPDRNGRTRSAFTREQMLLPI